MLLLSFHLMLLVSIMCSSETLHFYLTVETFGNANIDEVYTLLSVCSPCIAACLLTCRIKSYEGSENVQQSTKHRNLQFSSCYKHGVYTCEQIRPPAGTE